MGTGTHSYLGVEREIKVPGEDAHVELLAVPLSEHVAVGVDEEEVDDALVGPHVRRQHDHPHAHRVLGVVDHLVGADGDGQEPAGELEVALLLEDEPHAGLRPAHAQPVPK